jgi:hypothetical protein
MPHLLPNDVTPKLGLYLSPALSASRPAMRTHAGPIKVQIASMTSSNAESLTSIDCA